jgi:hypothetical protein
MMQPIATTSATVNEYIEHMKKDLYNTEYGKVGIVFTIHKNQVCYVQEIKEKQYQLLKTVDKTE